MPDYEIEHDIKIPYKAKYPLADMSVGDSFCLPLNGRTATALQRLASTRVRYQGKKLGRKFTIRQVDGGVRIWRTE